MGTKQQAAVKHFKKVTRTLQEWEKKPGSKNTTRTERRKLDALDLGKSPVRRRHPRAEARVLVLGHLCAAQRALDRLITYTSRLPAPSDQGLLPTDELRLRQHAEMAIPQAATELGDHVLGLQGLLGDWLGADAFD